MHREVTQINESLKPGVEVRATVIPMITLDQLIGSRTEQRWLIKVDVEGYEAEVLRGAESALKTADVDWLIEVHP